MKSEAKSKYIDAFKRAFEINDESSLDELVYEGIEQWDSIGHMSLVAEIEDSFGISLNTDDIIDFSSFKKGSEILKKYNIHLEI